mgnify:CR=1 FL=1
MIRPEKQTTEDDLLKRFELGLPMDAPLGNRARRPTREELKRIFGKRNATDRDPRDLSDD